MINRREFIGGALASLPLQAAGQPNLLFIMTDQQRFDALSCAGNRILQTPNLDRLAREGALFRSAVTPCPVCVPARTSILTGSSFTHTHVTGNNAAGDTELDPGSSFDNTLVGAGYRSEYYGKWHAPYRIAATYGNKVPYAGMKVAGAPSHHLQFLEYLDRHVPKRDLRPGERLSKDYNRPYQPAILDARYQDPNAEYGQGDVYGWLQIPKEHTLTAYTVDETLESLERMKSGPFSLTCSIGPPHPPSLNVTPYWGTYPAGEMPLPPNHQHDMRYSPYQKKAAAMTTYHIPENVRAMISIYYGMVKEVDDNVGRLLGRLDQMGLSGNTLVVFTSDHGEMLGSHGMNSKMTFHEESVRVPLMLRFPGRIAPGVVVNDTVSTMDLFPTILDYLGARGPQREGYNLRPLVEKRGAPPPDYRVSEWPVKNVPNYMVRTGEWKLMMGGDPQSQAQDALFHLKDDPYERVNLLGDSASRSKYRTQAAEMKDRLLAWLGRAGSPAVSSVKERKLA